MIHEPWGAGAASKPEEQHVYQSESELFSDGCPGTEHHPGGGKTLYHPAQPQPAYLQAGQGAGRAPVGPHKESHRHHRSGADLQALPGEQFLSLPEAAVGSQ